MNPAVEGYTNQQPQNTATGPSTSGEPVIVYVLNQSDALCSTKYLHYNGKTAAIFGSLQILLGFVSVVAYTSVLRTDRGVFSAKYLLPRQYLFYHGIWSPIFWLIAGGIGLASTVTKTGCTIISTMVMSIISALTTFPFLLWQSAIVKGYSNYSYDDESEVNIHRLSIVLLIVCILEGIVAIVASALCCKAVWCCRPTDINAQIATANGATQAIPLQTTAPSTVDTASAPPYEEQVQDKDKNGLVGHLVAPANEAQPDEVFV